MDHTNPFAFAVKEAGSTLAGALGIPEARENVLLDLIVRACLKTDQIPVALSTCSMHANSPAELAFISFSYCIVAQKMVKVRAAETGRCDCIICRLKRELDSNPGVPLGPRAEA